MPRATKTQNRKKLLRTPNITQRSKTKNFTANTSNAPATNLAATTSKTPPASANTTRTNPSPSSTTIPEQYLTLAIEQPPSQLPQTPQAPINNLTAGAPHFREFPLPGALFQSTTALPPRQNTATHSTAWFDRDEKQRLVLGSSGESRKMVTRVCEKPHLGSVENMKTSINFETICQTRLKNMVSNARTSNKRPKWINDTLWEKIQANWTTEE